MSRRRSRVAPRSGGNAERQAVVTALDWPEDKPPLNEMLYRGALERWLRAKAAGRLDYVFPFAHSRLVGPDQAAAPGWNALLLFVLSPGVELTNYVSDELSELAFMLDANQACLRRAEVMRVQTNLSMFEPRQIPATDQTKLRHFIEYIYSYAATRHLYYETQYQISGLAQRDLWERGFVGRFFGLESVQIGHSEAGMANWDVVHVTALAPQMLAGHLERARTALHGRAIAAGRDSAESVKAQWERQRIKQVVEAQLLMTEMSFSN